MNIDELKSHALAARREIVTLIYESGIGHPGGALSIIDIPVSYTHLTLPTTPYV